MPSSSKTPSSSNMDLDYSYQFNIPIRGRPATDGPTINTDCAIADDDEGIPLTALEELELFGPEPANAADALAMPPPPRPLPGRKGLAVATRGFRSTSASTSSSTPKSATPSTPLGFLPVKHTMNCPAYKRRPSYHAGNDGESSPFGDTEHNAEAESRRRPSFKSASPAPFGNVSAPPPSPSPSERGRSSSRCSSSSRRGSDVSMRDVSRKRRPSLMSILSPPGALDPLAPLKRHKKARDQAAMPPPPPPSGGSRGRSSASRK